MTKNSMFQCCIHEIKLQKLVIAPVKKELGLAFKGSQKNVVEALEVNNGFFFCCWGFIASVDFLKPDTGLQFVLGNEGERSLRDEGGSRIQW